LNGVRRGALVEEQAALRRVATLVARGVTPEEVFAAVVAEVARLMSVEFAHLGCYQADRTVIFLASWGRTTHNVPVGRSLSLGGRNISTMVFETGRPARIDRYADASESIGVAAREDGVGSGVGTPILVEGRLWGVMSAYAGVSGTLPADTEARLASFTELVATAIANAESRAALARGAEEHAALRRVATLVARGTPPTELFAAVAEEVGRLLGSHLAGMGRYESDDRLTMLASWAPDGDHPLIPGPWPLDGGDLASAVWRTGRPVRIQDYRGVPGPIAAFVRDELRIRASAGSPIVVEGRLWGVLFVHARQSEEPLPAETEARLTGFTELVATAIANTESRAELVASRARIVATADETRRRIQRDLHDGTQQRLVSLGLRLSTVRATVPPQLGELQDALSRVADGLAGLFDELGEISHGIHPAPLSEGGLDPALRVLQRRSAVPVELDLHAARRLSRPVEVATYYVVSEGLANAAKYARASVVHVGLDTRGAILRLAIHDDGIGGADPVRGSGLLGLSDRIEALGGTFKVDSPAGKGTTLLIEIPVEEKSGAAPPGP
jgi:signal transduction histidine kinase